jgi:TctA family transporter
VPSLIFGIPGDTITAIAIGVLYMKGLNPRPDAVHGEGVEHVRRLHPVHALQRPHDPARHRHDPLATVVLRAPRAAIMPVIVVLCAVGAFATGANLFAVTTVAAFGVIGFVMERNGFPVAALVLGLVMGAMVEQSFVTS